MGNNAALIYWHFSQCFFFSSGTTLLVCLCENAGTARRLLRRHKRTRQKTSKLIHHQSDVSSQNAIDQNPSSCRCRHRRNAARSLIGIYIVPWVHVYGSRGNQPIPPDPKMKNPTTSRRKCRSFGSGWKNLPAPSP